MGKDSCDFIQVSAGIRLTGSGATAAGSGAGEEWGTEGPELQSGRKQKLWRWGAGHGPASHR